MAVQAQSAYAIAAKASACPGPGGKPQQVLTGASVRDNRKAGDIGLDIGLGDSRLVLRQGWSSETDYKSTWTSVEGRSDFNHKNTTLAVGAAISDDGVSSHDAPDDFRQVQAVDELHDKDRSAVDLPGVVGPDEVRMVEPADGLHFALEAGDCALARALSGFL